MSEVIVTQVEEKKNQPLDSSYLRVTLFKIGYCISFFKDSLCTNDTTLIDRFISKRIDLIDKDKVFVIGDPNTRYDNFKAIKNIFKKHEIFRFKIAFDQDLH